MLKKAHITPARPRRAKTRHCPSFVLASLSRRAQTWRFLFIAPCASLWPRHGWKCVFAHFGRAGVIMAFLNILG